MRAGVLLEWRLHLSFSVCSFKMPLVEKFPAEVLLEILSFSSRLDLWNLHQTDVSTRAAIRSVPSFQAVQQLVDGAIRLEELEFPDPTLTANTTSKPLPLQKHVAVDYTAAFNPAGEVLVAARFHSTGRQSLQTLFSGNLVADGDALLTGRTFLLASPDASTTPAPGALRHTVKDERKVSRTKSTRAKVTLNQLSDANQRVPYSVRHADRSKQNIFLDTDGKAYTYERCSGFGRLPHPTPGVHYCPNTETFLLQAHSESYVVYVIERVSYDNPCSRVVVFDRSNNSVVIPSAGYDGAIALHKVRSARCRVSEVLQQLSTKSLT